MIEIRSAAPFCPVLTTCPPERVDTMLAALGVDRERVFFTAPMRRDDLEALREELRDAKEREDAQRRELGELEKAHEAARKERIDAEAKKEQMASKRDEARTTIRGLCAAFGRTPDDAAAQIHKAAKKPVKRARGVA